jgi:hypothetical protein
MFKSTLIRWLKNIRFSFPFQLLLLHVKKNALLLSIWIILFAVLFGTVAPGFGVQKQFLLPEYLGSFGAIAYFISGVATGGFFSAFHLYSYILHGYRFSFIHTLRHPFRIFVINNSILPVVFIVVYIAKSIDLAMKEELVSFSVALGYGVIWFLGILVFQVIVLAYFLLRGQKLKMHLIDLENSTTEEFQRVKEARLEKWRVNSYLSDRLNWLAARPTEHYSKELLDQILRKHQLSAWRFEVFLILSFLLLGAVSHKPALAMPTAASLLLICTLLLVFLSVLHHRLKGWYFIILVLSLVVLEVAYEKWDWLTLESRAFGLDYKHNVVYNEKTYQAAPEFEIEKSRIVWEKTLNEWKRKNIVGKDSLPKLVVLNVSGGGSRSAYWVMKSFMQADSICDGKLFPHTVLMTGASGGMLGATFLHELKSDELKGKIASYRQNEFCEQMAMDYLNPILASFTLNDWFIRYKYAHENGNSYFQDRGYTFERALANSTEGKLDKRLIDLEPNEHSGALPTLIFSPTIVNDGRRMLISTMPLAFMRRANTLAHFSPNTTDNIEFSELFKDNNWGNTSLLSVLRMNATFPYILPMMTLPTSPSIQCMDAGLRDNFGTKTSIEFIRFFEKWISENTSGVVILSIHDLPKGADLGDGKPSLIREWTLPLGSVYGNLTRTQDFNFDEQLALLAEKYAVPIDLVTFELQQGKDWEVSLSWHLTTKEKHYIQQALSVPKIQNETKRLAELINSNFSVSEN